MAGMLEAVVFAAGDQVKRTFCGVFEVAEEGGVNGVLFLSSTKVLQRQLCALRQLPSENSPPDSQPSATTSGSG